MWANSTNGQFSKEEIISQQKKKFIITSSQGNKMTAREFNTIRLTH